MSKLGSLGSLGSLGNLGYMLRTYGLRNRLRENLDYLSEALAPYDSSATLFVTAKWADSNKWIFRYAERYGYPYYPHGYRHRRFYTDPAPEAVLECKDDMEQAAAVFRDYDKRPRPGGFRAPYTGTARRPKQWYYALYGAGYSWDSSTYAPRTAPYGVPVPGTDKEITEIPIHTTDNGLAGRIPESRIAEAWIDGAEAARRAGRIYHIDLHPIRMKWLRGALNELLEAEGPASPCQPGAKGLVLSCDIDQATFWDYLKR